MEDVNIDAGQDAKEMMKQKEAADEKNIKQSIDPFMATARENDKNTHPLPLPAIESTDRALVKSEEQKIEPPKPSMFKLLWDECKLITTPFNTYYKSLNVTNAFYFPQRVLAPFFIGIILFVGVVFVLIALVFLLSTL